MLEKLESPTLYFLLVDRSQGMSHQKLTLLQKIVGAFLDSIPPTSLVWVAQFSESYEFLTEEPVLCNLENRDKLMAIINKRSEGLGSGIELTSLLHFCLKYNVEDVASKVLPSIIVVSNGALKEQSEVETLLEGSRGYHRMRISALGVGSGASDSFLNILSKKGLGVFDTIYKENQVKDRVNLFISRLNHGSIKNVRFNTTSKDILMLIPEHLPQESLLKGNPQEVFIFLREGLPSDKKIHIVQSYFDCDDKTEKAIRLTVNLETAQEDPAMMKYAVSKIVNLADYADEGTNLKLSQAFGNDWPIKLAIDNQVFSEKTSYLAIAQDLPKGFDPLHGNLKTLGTAQNSQKHKSVTVPSLTCEDYLPKKKKPTTEALLIDLNGDRYSEGKYDGLSRKINFLSDKDSKTNSGSKGHTFTDVDSANNVFKPISSNEKPDFDYNETASGSVQDPSVSSVTRKARILSEHQILPDSSKPLDELSDAIPIDSISTLSFIHRNKQGCMEESPADNFELANKSKTKPSAPKKRGSLSKGTFGSHQKEEDQNFLGLKKLNLKSNKCDMNGNIPPGAMPNNNEEEAFAPSPIVMQNCAQMNQSIQVNAVPPASARATDSPQVTTEQVTTKASSNAPKIPFSFANPPAGTSSKNPSPVKTPIRSAIKNQRGGAFFNQASTASSSSLTVFDKLPGLRNLLNEARKSASASANNIPETLLTDSFWAQNEALLAHYRLNPSLVAKILVKYSLTNSLFTAILVLFFLSKEQTQNPDTSKLSKWATFYLKHKKYERFKTDYHKIVREVEQAIQ